MLPLWGTPSCQILNQLADVQETWCGEAEGNKSPCHPVIYFLDCLTTLSNMKILHSVERDRNFE
jgi:hypothetical protein